MTKRSLAGVFGVSWLFACAACGNSDDSPHVAVVETSDAGASYSGSSGAGSLVPFGSPGASHASGGGADLESTSLLSELTSAQAVALCDATADAAEATFGDAEALHFTCFIAATTFSSRADGSLDLALCQQTFASCLADAELTSSSSERSCDEADLLWQFQGCGVTVNEFNRCTEQRLMALTLLLSSLDCESAAADSSDAVTLTDTPASCTRIMDECPNLELTGSSSSGLEPAADGCDNTCLFAHDGMCDDGGLGSDYSICGLGTDCADCGLR